MCWCYWGLLGVLHVRGSLNNLRVSRTHGLSYYIVCCINILRVSCCIISKLLALLFSIGIFSMSVNSDSIFLLNRSFLFCITGFAYHMNSHTFFAKDSFLCQHYMKKSIILHKLNLVREVMFRFERSQTNVTFSIANIFEFISKSASEDCMNLAKVHKCFFYSRVRNSGGEVHDYKHSIWLILVPLMPWGPWPLLVGFAEDSKIDIFIWDQFSEVQWE